MTCSQCGHDNLAGARFCNGCGTSLEGRCPRCGNPNPAGSRFCNSCGAPLQAATSSERVADPRSYTPKHLAEKILTSRSALEGERKQVTVLFADVKGSMDLAEQIDPEEWHQIMDRFFRILADGVHRFEGTVNEYRGDGIMALFGAPIAHEDHAARACYAVLSLQEDLRRYANELRVEKGISFSVRMGLNSGEVVVGRIGDDLRMDYTALGHTASLGARMEQIAAPDRANLTEHTAKLVEGLVQLEDLGKVTVKGVKEPLRVYELRGIGRLRTRLDVSRARGFTKFVGRNSEMAVLEAALDRAIAGSGQVVGVVADAGTGKSRLCFEFAERCRAREIPVYEAHGVAHGKGIPWLPILESLRGYFGIEERDTPRAARDKIAGRMVLLDETLAEGLPIMFDFLGVPDAERPTPLLDPEARQRQFFDVMRRVGRARSAREPAVHLFEDLHWFDRASEEFIENLVGVSPGNRTLVLLNFRPEYRASWTQRSHYQQLPLLPLGPEAIQELFADLLGMDSSLRHLTELIRERTGGNPFFIEEIVQSLVETGVLVGARGAYRLGKSVEDVGLPATVQSVLAARIDRLPEREKRVLQTASVIGKNFSEPMLRRVAELGDGDLPAALHALMNAEFIYEEALYPHAEYAFRHPLTQEVAYRSQLGEQRARVHAAVARAIEELEKGKLGERAALLAYHWEHAGEAREATKWHRRAAEWVGFNNAAEALRHWGSVRRLLDTLPERAGSLAERAAVRAHIMTYLARLGDVENQATSLFREGRELATRSGDTHVLSQVLNGFASIRWYAGAVTEALDPLLEAVRLADETDDVGLRVVVRYGLGVAYWAAGKLRECLAVAEQGLGLAREDPKLGADRLGFSPSLGLSYMHGGALILVGHPREGGKELDRVIELAHASQQLVPLSTSHSQHVSRCEVTGEAAPALAHGREAVDYAERTGSQTMRIFGYLSLGLANVLNGAWHDALEALGAALTIGKERRLLVLEGRVLAVMAAAHLGLGDRTRALTLAEEATAVSRRLGTRLGEFSALLTRIHALRETHGIEATREIEGAIAEADAWLEMSGAKSYEPFLHVERAELARLRGDETTRARELREAHRLFLEIGAPIRAEQVAKELAR
jgi:class 3 adenylate cyclase/tetratricopeptide (TPR) repeat protein